MLTECLAFSENNYKLQQCCMAINLVFWPQRERDHKFRASLDYLLRCLKKNPKIILIIIMLSCLSCNSSPRLRALARGLSPAYLRFGGTKTDFLIFDPDKEPTSEERSYWKSQVNHGKTFKRLSVLVSLDQS